MATHNRPVGADPCKPAGIIGDGNPFWISDTRAAFTLDALHLAKSGATRIDRPHFFSSALLALRVADILEG